MKKSLTLLLLVFVTICSIAQESVTNDSIVVPPLSPTSLEGLTFVSPTTSGSGEARLFYGMLYFTSSTEGVITFGWNAVSPNYIYDVEYFTYTVNASKITLTTKEDRPKIITGDIAGKTGMVLKVGERYFSYLVWK